MARMSAYKVTELEAIRYCQEVTVDDFVAVGINDLAKYRIVQFLSASPEGCWDVRACAERLGLRPIERAVVELEELVERKILERLDVGDATQYRLTREKEKRLQLARLFVMAQPRLRYSSILSRLAARSLERVRASNRRKKRKRGHLRESRETPN